MIKILTAVCIALLYAVYAAAQPVVKVDERLEFSGIAFRLAGAEEYVDNSLPPQYAEAIEKYFAPYKNHPFIAYIKELRKEPYEVAYNAVPLTANCVIIGNGKLEPRPGIIRSIVSEDPRWTRETLARYTELAADFYRKSKFHLFFLSQKDLYDRAAGQMDSMLQEISYGWFRSFFGNPLGNPAVYVCVSYGFNNYSLPAAINYLDNTEENGIIMGYTEGKESGISPTERISTKKVIIHELCHNYSNPLSAAYLDIIKVAGDKIFPYVKNRLIKGAYGDAATMLVEGLNGLCVRMYYRECEPGMQIFGIADDEERGFVWTGRAVKFMDNFYADRQTYPAFADFMPQLAGFINYTANNIETVMKEFENRHPYVESVYPAPGTTVSSDIKEIRIRFSRPMYTQAYGILECGQDVMFIPSNTCHWEDDRTFAVVLTENLEKGTTYGFSLPFFAFIDGETGHRLNENFDVIFKTCE